MKLSKNLLLYCYEGLGLGIFMFSAGLFDVLIDHPNLPIRTAISSALLRRFLIGLSMGLTALAIIHSPFGKKSGANINPAVTLVWYKLGKITGKKTFFYCLSQFVGGTIGMYCITILLPTYIAHPAINYIVTIPPKNGILVAFIVEFFISGLLIFIVLITRKNKSLAKYTSFFVAILITLYITFEAPYSGMSMNPARTFASAFIANQWNSFWIYCIAPISGMQLAAWLQKRF